MWYTLWPPSFRPSDAVQNPPSPLKCVTWFFEQLLTIFFCLWCSRASHHQWEDSTTMQSTIHRLEGSREGEVGGLVLQKKPAKDEEGGELFKMPAPKKRSLLGLDTLAQQRRREKESEERQRRASGQKEEEDSELIVSLLSWSSGKIVLRESRKWEKLCFMEVCFFIVGEFKFCF